MSSQPQPVKKLTELAAAAAATAEVEGTHDYQASETFRNMIDAAKVEIKKELAKQALKDVDVKKCTALCDATLQVLDKRIKSWGARVEDMKKIAPHVKTDPTAAAQWKKIKAKADASLQKYENLENALKALQNDLKKSTKLNAMIKCTTVLAKLNYLKAEIKRAESLLL